MIPDTKNITASSVTNTGTPDNGSSGTAADESNDLPPDHSDSDVEMDGACCVEYVTLLHLSFLKTILRRWWEGMPVAAIDEFSYATTWRALSVVWHIFITYFFQQTKLSSQIACASILFDPRLFIHTSTNTYIMTYTHRNDAILLHLQFVHTQKTDACFLDRDGYGRRRRTT